MGKKLHYQNDEFENDHQEDFNEGDMQVFNSYKAYDLDSKLASIKSLATETIKEMLGMYLDKSIIDDQSYIRKVAEVESMNLSNLLYNVSVSEHMLSTLVRQLDSGGNVNPELFRNISRMQEDFLNITLQVSTYVRNIPQFVKSIKDDVQKYTILEISSESTKIGNEKPADGYTLAEPTIGSKNLVMAIQEQISAAKAADKLAAEERKKTYQEDIPKPIDAFSKPKDVKILDDQDFGDDDSEEEENEF